LGTSKNGAVLEADKVGRYIFSGEELASGESGLRRWRGREDIGLKVVRLKWIPSAVLQFRCIRTEPTFRGTMKAIGSMEEPATLYARAISQSETLNARRGRKHMPR
jgi:hypothetical protein